MDICKLAYELYKIDWKKSHMITPEIEKDNLKDYYEDLVDFDNSYSYADYIEECGYNGELYVCFDEFIDCEYQDADYIKELLDNDKLFEEYLKDCQGEQITENRIVVKLENGKEIVAELCNYDGNHPEIVICIQENGIAVQDICIVRPHEEDDMKTSDIDCLVWGDEYSEDYTDKFIIPQYIEEE